MRSALLGVDVVCERDDVFVISVVILHGDFNRYRVEFLFKIKNVAYGFFVFVKVFHVFDDTAVILQFVARFSALSLILENDFKPLVEERKIAQCASYGVVIEFRRFKNFRIGFKSDSRTGKRRIFQSLQTGSRHASVVFLTEVFTLLINVYRSGFGKRVDGFETYAVKPGRDHISAAAEFAARVGFRHDDFDRGHAFFFVYSGRNASSVIHNGAGTVLVDGYGYGVAIACESLVDRIVDNFFDKMVQTSRVGRRDVHTRSFPDVFKPFENLNLIGAVILFDSVFVIHYFLL